MEPLHILRALLRSWLIVGLFAVAGTAGGLIVYANTTPRYESQLQLVVPSGTSRTVDAATLRQQAIDRTEVAARIAATSTAVRDARRAAGVSGGDITATATSTPNAPFLTVVVDGTDPSDVRAVADAFSDTLAGSVARTYRTGATAIELVRLGPATYSSAPYTPRLIPDILFGLAAGIVLGASLVVLREMLNQSADDGDDLQRITGLRVLGTVARDMPKVLLPSSTEPRSVRAEAYRQIRTALLTRAGTPARTLAVTSSLAREGKTSVSTNLAVAFARAGRSVALVDADLRRPQVADFLDVSGPGLVDVLTGSVQLEQALIRRDDGPLDVLAAGSSMAEPSELLDHAGLDRIIRALAATHEFVIVDTPPVLPVADALVIAARVDATVLVAQLGRTRRDEIRRTQKALSDAGVTVLGVVGNRAERGSIRRYRYDYSSALPAGGVGEVPGPVPLPPPGSSEYVRTTARPSPRPRPADDETAPPGRHRRTVPAGGAQASGGAHAAERPVGG